ncbi:MAG: RHS repeat protein [Candidatus Omnitrophica bacterium]|nr:RHS repeat protein [Candidatus Omnitrophota bacterium]
MIDPAGNRVNYTYDAFGRLTRLTDPNGQVTVFEYDLLGRMTYVGAERATTPTVQSSSVQSFSTESSSKPSYTPLIWDALQSRYDRDDDKDEGKKKRKVNYPPDLIKYVEAESVPEA